MTSAKNFDGVLKVNKPVGPTSHDVVYRCRRILGRETKVGHTGTLDPFASGVLVIVTGQATRLARYLQATEKEYIAEVRLGQETDTCDREGRIVAEKPVPSLSERDTESALQRFRGPIQQIPPMYSAVKINGKRLYKLARKNETIERPPRDVEIFSLDLVEETENRLKLKIICSSGTYIRSLAHDLGLNMGCGAHLSSLVRTRSGPFTISETLTLDELKKDPRAALVPMHCLLPEIPSIEINRNEARLVRDGRPLPGKTASERSEYRLTHHGELVSISLCHGELLHPKIVFPAPRGPE